MVIVEFTDQPRGKRFWWFLNEDGHAELCVKEPGFGVDLFVAASLPDKIWIWRGDLTLGYAIDSGVGPGGRRPGRTC